MCLVQREGADLPRGGSTCLSRSAPPFRGAQSRGSVHCAAQGKGMGEVLLVGVVSGVGRGGAAALLCPCCGKWWHVGWWLCWGASGSNRLLWLWELMMGSVGGLEKRFWQAECGREM